MITSGHERILELACHESEFPERQARGLLEGLRARRLPGKWLYHYPAQAALWLTYHQAWSPSRTDTALAGLYREAFAAALDALGRGAPDAVSLGCGGGHKDAELIALALKGGGAEARPRYMPVDTSQPLVLEAALHVARRFPGLVFHPLVADLAADPDLGGWLDGLDPRRPPRLFTCFGMVPNMDGAAFLPYLGGLPRAGDALLVSANLSPGGLAADRERILPQYDNPPARHWYAAGLEPLGIAPGDVELSVAAEPLEGEGAWQVVVEAEPQRDVEAAAFGERVGIGRGERLRVFHSARFTAEAFERRLGEAGLPVARRWIGASGEEGIFLCSGGAVAQRAG